MVHDKECWHHLTIVASTRGMLQEASKGSDNLSWYHWGGLQINHWKVINAFGFVHMNEPPQQGEQSLSNILLWEKLTKAIIHHVAWDSFDMMQMNINIQ